MSIAPIALPEAPPQSRTWHVVFSEKPPPGYAVLHTFGEPWRMLASCREQPSADAPAAPSPDDRELWFTRVLESAAGRLPPGSDGRNGRAIDIEWRRARLSWRPGRAVARCDEKSADLILSVAAHFAFLESELRRAEAELASDGQSAYSDADLTHEVGASELTRWPQVNLRTRRAIRRRMVIADIERDLDLPPADWPDDARQLLSRLGEHAGMPDRLESAAERAEVICDLYETANDRLTEYSYFRREARLEQWIIVILVAEVVLLLLELWVNWLR